MNKLCVALIGLMIHTSPLWAQTAVQQTGAVTNNSPVMWASDHHIRQAAGSSGGVAGRMITGGFSAVGQVCSYSNTTDQSGIALCLDAANSALIYNGTAYPIAGGGGNVVGPVPTTVNDFALWNNTTGTLLKNAAGVVAAHTGGMTTTDTTTPTTWTADPFFGPGYTWKTSNLFQLNNAPTHAGQVSSTVGILNKSTGSGNGPTQNDLALILGCQKTDYLTTTVEGEQDCMFAHINQGARGDSAVYLASNAHVDNPAYPNYGLTVFEAAAFHVRPTTGTIFRSNRPVLGYGITGFQDVTAIAAGAGGVCRLTVENTGHLNVAIGVSVVGVKGAPECNGFWGATVVNATQIDLTGSVLVGTYTSGGAVGTPIGSIGGPTVGVLARAQTGQNGTGVLVMNEPGFVGSWGSAFKGMLYNDNQVYFDMSAQSGRFVVQPPGTGSLVDENYSATFLNGGIRWASNQLVIPRDNQQAPAITSFPGGAALTFNYCSVNTTPAPGCAAAEVWRLSTSGSATFSVYRKTSATAAVRDFNVSENGSTLATAFEVTGGGMTVGVPTGGYKGTGTLNLAGDLYNNNTAPTGTGGYVRATTPTLVTPVIGAATGTSLTATGLLHAFSGTAIPAGGTTGSCIKVSSVSNFGICFGSGVPTLSAAQGTIYLRSDGSSTSTRMYINTDGGTTWTAVTTAA